MKKQMLCMCTVLIALCTMWTGCEQEDPVVIPYGKSVGVFSVDKIRQVTFSPGNLQYNPRKNEWRFAEHQYDYIGEENIKLSPNYAGWIDLFGWGTGDNPTKTNYKSEEYSSFVDWGKNTIGTDVPETWRTLGKYEWEYILFHRKHAKKLYAAGMVNGVCGLIILPDGFSKPSGISWKARATDCTTNNYTKYEWEKMQQLGAVFLPAAGLRYLHYSAYGSPKVTYEDSENCPEGYYWASEGERTTIGVMVSTTGFCMKFRAGNGFEIGLDWWAQDECMTSTSRGCGCSVRLVQRISATAK